MIQYRVNRLRQTLKEKNIDAFLISNFFNILYLSDFKTLTENEREAWMLITNKSAYLFTDSRYLDNKTKLNNNIYITKLISPEKGLLKHLEEIFEKEEIKSCGLEGDDLKVLEFERIKTILSKTNFVYTDKLIIKQRERKDIVEVEKIKKACQVSDQCLLDISKTIKIGQTEKEIAFKIEYCLKEKGYDLAFYPIVAIDENSAVAHYDTRENGIKKVKNGSIILIDFGAKYKNYLSDMTRMIFVGKPNNEIISTYNKLLDAQIKTILKIKAEDKGKEVDIFCRDLITNKNQLPNYLHSTGHGVGLEIHEYPKISFVSEDVLFENQVVTIEPGVYFEGKWGMRIEDTVAITKDSSEVLTKTNKKLLII